MRFFRDAPDVVTRIQYYRVPDDRPYLPVPTLFTSTRWLNDNAIWDGQDEGFAYPLQGESMDSPKVWANGKDPNKTVWIPGKYLGTEAEWRGEMYTPPPPLSPAVAAALAFVRGRGYLPLDCCSHTFFIPRCRTVFPDNGPSTFFAHVGPLAPFNPDALPNIPADPWPIQWVGPQAPCAWLSVPGIIDDDKEEVFFTVEVNQARLVTLNIFSATLAGVTYQATAPLSWDGIRPLRLAREDTVPFDYPWPLTTILTGVQ